MNITCGKPFLCVIYNVIQSIHILSDVVKYHKVYDFLFYFILKQKLKILYYEAMLKKKLVNI